MVPKTCVCCNTLPENFAKILQLGKWTVKAKNCVLLPILWLCAFPLAAGSLPALGAEPPNVVMLIGDDQAWGDYGFMGHPVIRTPNLDRLASESALFRRGYVPASLCRPSLATLISGLYPHQHKIAGNDPSPGTDRNLMLKHIRRIPSLPRLLGKQGYVSHQSGKWWEGNYSEGGFSAGMTHGDTERGGRHGDDGLKIGREGLQPVFDFIDGTAGKPFFIWYAPFLPHTPHNPPKRLLDKYKSPERPIELSRYYAMCEWFDETCGELLDGLESRSLAENTLVVFVTDNGWIQRTPESDLPEGWRYPFAPKSKRSPYDGGIRTPITFRWPKKIAPAEFDTPISSIDIAPTILAATGIEPPEELPGVDLLPMMAAPELELGRDPLFGEIFDHDVPNIDDPAPGLQYRWCIDGRWKLIVPADENEPLELYDLLSDPHETRNVAADHPQETGRLKQMINDWWTP